MAIKTNLYGVLDGFGSLAFPSQEEMNELKSYEMEPKELQRSIEKNNRIRAAVREWEEQHKELMQV